LVGVIIALGWGVYFMSRKERGVHKGTHAHQP